MKVRFAIFPFSHHLLCWWQCETCTVWKFNHYMWSWCHFYEADLAVLIIDRRQMFGNVRKWTQTFKREILFGIKRPHLFFFFIEICKKITGQCCATLSLFQVGWSGPPPTKKIGLRAFNLCSWWCSPTLVYQKLMKVNVHKCKIRGTRKWE